jgi:hypothetical protein
LLEIADDARIEGRRSIVDPDAIIETVGTLRRITHRLASAAAARELTATPPLTPEFDGARAQFDAALTEHFGGCLDFVKRHARGAPGTIPYWDEARARNLLETLDREIAADSFAAISTFSVQERRALLADMENSRRLTVLAGELAEQLARIRPGQRAIAA